MDIKPNPAVYRIDAPVQDMPKADRPPREANVTAEGAKSARMKPVTSKEDKAAALPDGYTNYNNPTFFKEEIDKIVSLLFPNVGVNFTIHESTGQVITHVFNRDTDEVIREFPAEKMLDIIHNLCERLGLIIDTKG